MSGPLLKAALLGFGSAVALVGLGFALFLAVATFLPGRAVPAVPAMLLTAPVLLLVAGAGVALGLWVAHRAGRRRAGSLPAGPGGPSPDAARHGFEPGGGPGADAAGASPSRDGCGSPEAGARLTPP
ncbi:hypothetical protein OPKNFCMD_0443 [Methylobacterium crusticola]|uniref:Uncharacterized protein n=1 Tax=Methylobacterium crusticola TaxID=1697972 RepID=A0ABQ4QR26_9HYPH|nr:hypothetical protein [Methylobacterium crusticola]GJD47733.1 hypothetical protein OPKNFCMD_0443 [Methylobacterium crusticola]